MAAGGCWRAGWRLGASAALVLGTLVGSLATDVLPDVAEVAALAGAVAASAGLLWPLIGPLKEIEQLAGAPARNACACGGSLASPPPSLDLGCATARCARAQA